MPQHKTHCFLLIAFVLLSFSSLATENRQTQSSPSTSFPSTQGSTASTKPPVADIDPGTIRKFRQQWLQYMERARQLRETLLAYAPAQSRQGSPGFGNLSGQTAPASLTDEAIEHLLRIGYTRQQLEIKTQLISNELARLDALRTATSTSSPVWQSKNQSGIFADEPELIEEGGFPPKPAVCQDTSFALVWGFIHTNNVLETLLAADRWFCKQEEFGENAALECAIIEELVALSSNVVRTGGICLSAKGTARTEANLENLDSIEDFLQERLNVTVSSRASETQLENLKTGLETVQHTLDDYLPVQFPAIGQRLDDLIAALATNEQDLLDLQTRTADLEQRALLTRAEAEDIDQRLADGQQGAMEIRADTETIRADLQGLRSHLAQHDSRQRNAFQLLTRDSMAAILSQDGRKSGNLCWQK